MHQLAQHYLVYNISCLYATFPNTLTHPFHKFLIMRQQKIIYSYPALEVVYAKGCVHAAVLYIFCSRHVPTTIVHAAVHRVCKTTRPKHWRRYSAFYKKYIKPSACYYVPWELKVFLLVF